MMSIDANSITKGTRVKDASTPTFAPVPTLLHRNTLADMPLIFSETPDMSLMEESDDCIIRWYPMRIRYGRPKRTFDIEDHLQAMGYTTFLHLQREPDPDAIWDKDKVKPGITNLLFVKAMKLQLKALKRYDNTCSLMQFMPKFSLDRTQKNEIIWIPEKQMENFIDVSTRPDPYGQRIPLTYSDFLDKQGKRVRILHGPFKNIEGEVKRINRQRIVVALLRDAKVALGITCIPPENLELIDNT